MINLSEHHQHLLLGKITQTLSDDEVTEINNLLSYDVEIQQAYKELLNKIPHELTITSFKKTDQPGYWKNLAGEYRNKAARKKLVMISWASAAALIAGLAFTFWIYQTPGKASNKTAIAYKQNNETIRLQLANGKIINLDNEKGNIEEESASIINDGKTLSYSSHEKKASGMNSVFVPTGKDYKITLSDGSEIWMNSLTTLDFPFEFTGNTREITITGEAYCKIAKNSSKPFIIHLPNSLVKVLGTEFNVNTYKVDLTAVSLVEGKINVTGGNKTVAVNPGTQTVFDGKSIIEKPFDSKTVLSWRQGLFFLDETDIVEISGLLKRWYGVQVVVNNPVLYKKRFAGVINKNLPIEAFLDDLKAIAKINSSFSKDGSLHFK